MKKRLLVSCAIGASVFAVTLMQVGGAQEPVVVKVSAESVGITIIGGEIDFGGPFKPGQHLRAHPQTSMKDAEPATIVNTGNVVIDHIDIAYDGPRGQEAICDGGTGHWAANASSVGEDRFYMRAWASTNGNWSQFTNAGNAKRIDPESGSTNILHAESLAPDESVPLLLHLQMPEPMVSGGDGCLISLSVTAAVMATPTPTP